MSELSHVVIAIDGPAGAGKSTVAKMLAKRLRISYLDTGAMYRALALKAHRHGFGPFAGDEVAAIGNQTTISFSLNDDDDDVSQRVFLDGEDVTDQIRRPEIGQLASEISTHPMVRRILVERQKAIVAKGGVTLEGRDVTTVVAPNATLKVYLTASLEERAQRRLREFQQKGLQTSSFDRVRVDIEMRDHRDITREDSPLKVAEDAMVLDSANMTPEQVTQMILERLQAISA